MDIDKPLSDIISDKRKSEPRKSDTRKAPRTSTGSERRPGSAPYARPSPRSTEDKWVHDSYQGGQNRDRRNGGAANAIAGTGAGFTGVSTRIEVIGLHYEVTPADLKTIFSQAGTLVQGPTIREDMNAKYRIHIVSKSVDGRRKQIAYAPLVYLFSPYDRSGRSKGEATMEFASPQQAKIAINKFDGAMTKGQTISIKLLPPIVAKLRGSPAGAGAGGAGAAASGQSLLARIQGGGASAAPSKGAQRGGRGDRGGPPRGRGAARGGAARRGPTNQGDLDKELDSFMTNSGDVEMA